MQSAVFFVVHVHVGLILRVQSSLVPNSKLNLKLYQNIGTKQRNPESFGRPDPVRFLIAYQQNLPHIKMQWWPLFLKNGDSGKAALLYDALVVRVLSWEVGDLSLKPK